MEAFVLNPSRAQPLRVEEFLPLKEAAVQLKLHDHQLQRAATRDMFPTYTPFGRRIYVRLSEVIAAIEAARVKYSSEFSISL